MILVGNVHRTGVNLQHGTNRPVMVQTVQGTKSPGTVRIVHGTNSPGGYEQSSYR